MKGIFITGTDTDVGKTVVSGLLGRYLLNKGYSVITQKWIQTGSKRFPIDITSHLKLMKKQKRDIKYYLPHLSSYTFGFASSPHLAANLAGKRIGTNKIKDSFRFLSKKFDFVIVEGIGGALVPFNRKRLIIDIAKELRLPVLIVADNKLGAINHTLLTIEAIKNRNMKIAGVIFNNKSLRTNRVILDDNPRIIKNLTGEAALGVLPHLKNRDCLYKAFAPIGKKILNRLKRKC